MEEKYALLVRCARGSSSTFGLMPHAWPIKESDKPAVNVAESRDAAGMGFQLCVPSLAQTSSSLMHWSGPASPCNGYR